MKPQDFAECRPRLRLEDFFAGHTRAWGVFYDRFGVLRSQFKAEIDGRWDGETLALDERFDYSNGKQEQRNWAIRPIGEHRYEGRAQDVVGVAKGAAFGNAFNWRYRFALGDGRRKLVANFNDWMFLQDTDVLFNRVKVSKFGLSIGVVIILFQRRPARGSMPDLAFAQGGVN